MSEETSGLAAITDFVRHSPLCGVVGGYDRCTCGMEEALVTFERTLDHLKDKSE